MLVCCLIRQKARLALQEECGTARDQEQEALVAQMSTEAKMAILERRVQDSKQNASMPPSRSAVCYLV